MKQPEKKRRRTGLRSDITPSVPQTDTPKQRRKLEPVYTSVEKLATYTSGDPPLVELTQSTYPQALSPKVENYVAPVRRSQTKEGLERISKSGSFKESSTAADSKVRVPARRSKKPTVRKPRRVTVELKAATKSTAAAAANCVSV